jgi:Holliday junction resolvase RusA-like endonuclease
MDDVLYVIEIPDYIKHVILSQKRRAVYWTAEDKNLPAKVRAKVAGIDSKKRLLDAAGKPIIKNSRSVGTPRMKKINGQDIYSGYSGHFFREALVSQVKESFMKVLKDIPRLQELPVRIDAQLHEEPGQANWDLDNLWIYVKCMLDCLTASGIIPEDTIEYVTKAPGFEYFPIKPGERRKMVFILRRELRDDILNHPLYKTVQDDIRSDDTEF